MTDEPRLDGPRLAGQLAFLLEADRLKQVERRTTVVGGERRENSAEHSWHLALFALVLAEYADEIVEQQHREDAGEVHRLVGVLGQDEGEQGQVPGVLRGVLPPLTTHDGGASLHLLQPIGLEQEGQLARQSGLVQS